MPLPRLEAGREWLAETGHAWVAFAALLATAAGLGLFGLMRTPPPFVDEAWYASRAWALIQSGQAFGALDRGVFDNYEGYWTYYPLLGTWFQAQAIRSLGLNLFAVRVTSLLFGLLLLGAVYTVGVRLGGTRLGLFAMLLVSLSEAFLLSSHLARHDIMVAALGFGAIALYVTDRASAISVRSILSGLAVGLAFEIHVNGMIYGPAIAGLYLLDHGSSVLRAKRFWGFAAGLCGGLLFYAAMHVLPYPQTFLSLTSLAYSSTHTPPVLVPDPSVWLQSAVDSAWFLLRYNVARAPLVVWGFLALARRGSMSDRKLLMLFSSLFLALVLMIRNKIGYYAILTTPASDLLVAALLAEMTRERWHSSLGSLLRTGVALGMAVASIAPALPPTEDTTMEDYRDTLHRLAQVVSPDGTLMGSQTYWFMFPEQEYLSWQQLVYYQAHAPGSGLEDALYALQPDYLITDRHMEQFIGDDPAMMSEYARFLYLSRSELEGFLIRQSHLVASVETATFGDVRVYEIDWTR